MRNQNSRFSLNPTNIDMPRSRFSRDFTVKTSFNVGDIVPFYLEEVLPGDTFSVDTNYVARLQTLLAPIMDNIYLDTYYFFVPNRLIWEHWKNFMGENTQSAWIPTTSYTIPQITAPSGGWNIGTIADYLGVPTGVDKTVNALPFRAYAKLCDDWFRDENLSAPLNIPVNDSTVTGVNTGTFVTDVAKGGLPYTAAKYHDVFTSALPAPQKGPDVSIGLSGSLPVITRSNAWPESSLEKNQGMKFYTNQSGSPYTLTNSIPEFRNIGGNNYKFDQFADVTRAGSSDTNVSVVPSNLMVNLAGASAITINNLRLAFQLQKLYEKDARGGTRYIEIIKSHFGVTSPDYRLQRSEYLGGMRNPLNIKQVVQTSGTISDSSQVLDSTPQGNTTAYSLTSTRHSDFTKSFTEHGYIIGVCVARYDHTYQQGLNRLWSRSTRFDYYWPVLSNIGEVGIKNQEIYCNGSSTDEQIFGYQEAWYDYRYKPSMVTGQMRSSSNTGFDIWHLGDDYASLPSLSDSWIREDKSNVDRTLAVTSSVANQIFADFYIKNTAVRPIPMYSVPGLIDHH